MKSLAVGCASLLLLLSTFACSNRTNPASYKDSVEKALEQADLKGVSVSEDGDKNTITLSGKLHSADAKTQAAQVAQSAAGPRIIANEIGVEPVGSESQAKNIESNVDDGIESNYKAALISRGLDKQDIGYDAKNGVLTLKGKVKSMKQRQEAQDLAKNVPNVAQVVNQIDVAR